MCDIGFSSNNEQGNFVGVLDSSSNKYISRANETTPPCSSGGLPPLPSVPIGNYTEEEEVAVMSGKGNETPISSSGQSLSGDDWSSPSYSSDDIPSLPSTPIINNTVEEE
ncbi:hypothetical protein SERLA73DRAFT_71661 [Serpula lacrymans var. lacrymans S7.3]|uniref:Uncharacterized protein n=2 Tax=Serpula lacrymans var. lacrymans TaxID=341189 RepID=F8PRZ7_SERL3|nr:uncharacterized protein SERLADRAFT_436048 [Serpula lacrymans var. lacrymans S7.9]EGO00663.1 hypothetical protein SERLA73DRAFT_71661 [Serpula lacrymans var. lacrymans S7.3]EGO26215.1 hypothetical protein SERLADRAFT_436048 [Serpula lacrymans var. lacrymans S7.9]